MGFWFVVIVVDLSFKTHFPQQIEDGAILVQVRHGQNIARRPRYAKSSGIMETDVMEIEFTRVVPILRIFDVAKADEFYLGFLGFSVDWDHRFDADAPLYRQI